MKGENERISKKRSNKTDVIERLSKIIQNDFV